MSNNTPNFEQIKDVCHGMMRPEVYRKIYETAFNTPGKLFVELGSAHGASAVCLALALKNTGRTDGKVYTFDKFSSGGRKYYENENDNLNYLKDNLKKFGVDDAVEIFKIDIDTLTKKNVDSMINSNIDLIMLDNDGKIDRDFALFFDKLSDGASIIIDDMADRVRVSNKITYFRVDQKHKITYLLTKSAENSCLLKYKEMEYQTWFGTKGSSSFSAWDQEEIIRNYRKLVFSNSERQK